MKYENSKRQDASFGPVECPESSTEWHIASEINTQTSNERCNFLHATESVLSSSIFEVAYQLR